MAVRAGLGANECRPGDAWRRHDRLVQRAAGKRDHRDGSRAAGDQEQSEFVASKPPNGSEELHKEITLLHAGLGWVRLRLQGGSDVADEQKQILKYCSTSFSGFASFGSNRGAMHRKFPGKSALPFLSISTHWLDFFFVVTGTWPAKHAKDAKKERGKQVIMNPGRLPNRQCFQERLPEAKPLSRNHANDCPRNTRMDAKVQRQKQKMD
jgi:hypothetical protein